MSEQLMFTATAFGINMHCMNDHGLVNSPSCFVHINWQPPEDRQRLPL
jgi:cytosine/adenosine deaminase-related metal-dependent hydrolase